MLLHVLPSVWSAVSVLIMLTEELRDAVIMTGRINKDIQYGSKSTNAHKNKQLIWHSLLTWITSDRCRISQWYVYVHSDPLLYWYSNKNKAAGNYFLINWSILPWILKTWSTKSLSVIGITMKLSCRWMAKSYCWQSWSVRMLLYSICLVPIDIDRVIGSCFSASWNPLSLANSRILTVDFFRLFSSMTPRRFATYEFSQLPFFLKLPFLLQIIFPLFISSREISTYLCPRNFINCSNQIVSGGISPYAHGALSRTICSGPPHATLVFSPRLLQFNTNRAALSPLTAFFRLRRTASALSLRLHDSSSTSMMKCIPDEEIQSPLQAKEGPDSSPTLR